MKRQNHKNKLLDLLRGHLTPEEEKKVLAGLQRSGISRKEIEALQSVDRLIEEAHVPGPTDRMDKRFYAMLEEAKKEALLGEPEIVSKKVSFAALLAPGLRIAAGIALFLIGWFASGWFGSAPSNDTQIANLAGEVQQLKETLVLTMMQQKSTVERIKAVNMAEKMEMKDNRIFESLLSLLNHDSNDNVRLLALDALLRYSSVPEIRDGLVASIGNQTSPLVQLRLTEVMLALDEKRAVPQFREVLENVNLNYNVRSKMNEALDVLL